MTSLTLGPGTQLNRHFVRVLAIAGPVVVGVILAAMTLGFGELALVAVVTVIALPWFVRDPFRLYLVLVVTWPVLNLYLRLPLPQGLPDLSYSRVLVLSSVALVVLPALAYRKRLPALGILVGFYAVVQISSYSLRWLWGGIATPNLVILFTGIVMPISMYWLTKTLVKSRWHLKLLLLALILASVVVCMSGLYERALDTRESPFPVSTGTASGERYLGVSRGRAAGVFGNPAIYGAVLGVGALAGLCCYVHAQRKSTKILLAVTILLLAYGVLVSFTRSAWVSFLVGIFVAQFFMADLWKRTVWISLVGILAALLLGVFAFDQIANSQLVQDRILEKDNVIGRVDRAAFSWDRFSEKPFFGWGPDALDELMGQEFGVRGKGFDSSHNTYLTMLVDGGLVVFFSFAALLAFWLSRAVQVVRGTKQGSFERSVLGVMLGSMLIFLVSGLFLELKFFSYFNALFWIAAASIERLSVMIASSNEKSLAPRLRLHGKLAN